MNNDDLRNTPATRPSPTWVPGAAPVAQIRPSSLQRLKGNFVEYAKFDSPLFKTFIGMTGLLVATLLRWSGRQARALEIETSLHSGAFSAWVDSVIERRVRKSLSQHPPLEGYLETLTPQCSTESFFSDPRRLIGHRILIVKSPTALEKGVLMLDYSFVFSLFAKFFNVPAIAERYHIILEPSWSGFCDPDILSLAGQQFPVFVQNYEPRDISFVERLASNLISVPIAANWWVDHRIFRPLAGVERDADLLFNSAWARFKRHDAFFKVLARLRARGHRLKTLLVGYPVDLRRDDILALAADHGIDDQLEIFEGLKPAEINYLLNRVKVNVLWSRREGFNRALIEGFFAGIPCVMHKGFNFGYLYPYINPSTGHYATDIDLGERLIHMIENFSRYDPRGWVAANMNPQVATRVLDEHIAQHSAKNKDIWTQGQIAVKVTSLHSMAYWDEKDQARFESDYGFVREKLRTGHNQV